MLANEIKIQPFTYSKIDTADSAQPSSRPLAATFGAHSALYAVPQKNWKKKSCPFEQTTNGPSQKILSYELKSNKNGQLE